MLISTLGVCLMLRQDVQAATQPVTNNTSSSSSAKKQSVVTLYVGPDCKYTTISQAVEAAPEWSRIYIKNGIYTEAIKITKNLTLTGESLGGVVIQFPCDSYLFPPLEAHCGRFENLVIQACGEETEASGSKSYAVHCEKMSSLHGSSITFTNCVFESKGNWDVGMGSSNGFRATFNNCVFNGKGMFYHSYGKDAGCAITSTISLGGCVFAPGTAFEVHNFYADNSKVNVIVRNTALPLGKIVSFSGGVGSPLVLDERQEAKNIVWNIK